MKRFAVVLVALLVALCLILAATSDADGSCRVAFRQVAYVQPYVAPYVAPVAYPQAAYVVSYGDADSVRIATLAISVLAQRADKQDAVVQELLARLQGVQGSNGNGVQPGTAKPLQQGMPRADDDARQAIQQGDYAALVTAHCAACHAEGSQKLQGRKGALTLLSGGKARQLTGEELGEVFRRVTSRDPAQRMPPRGMTGDEARDLIAAAIVAHSNP